jgi:hypothetical protein
MMIYTLSTSIPTAFAEDDPFMEKDYSDIVIPTGGITDELYDVMEQSNEQDLIPVDIWITPIDIDEIENQVKNTIGFNKADITAPYDRANFDIPIENEYTADQVDLYIETERQMYSDCQLEQTEAFIQECLDIKNLQTAYNSEDIFISHYAPLVRVELTKDEIIQIAENSKVEEIYYSPDVEMEDETDISIPLIHGNYTRDTLGLTGSGIKIGQIEVEEVDPSKSYLTSSNIFFDTSKQRNPGHHPSFVASIMVAKSSSTYPGIVPDAQLYSAYYTAGSSNDWRTNVEWLLNQGVNVINMSAYLNTELAGMYGTQEQWVDHIAINHSVHFIKSSGNDSSYVTSPGMAYNIITVGGIDDNNTATQSDDIIYSASNYNEMSGLTNKPDICAPAVNIKTADPEPPSSGTSLSAPHVTAVVAQLCQHTPALKVMQSTVKSIITAGISHSVLSFDSSSGTDFDTMGAGCVDAQASHYIANIGRYVGTTFAANTSNGTTHNYSFYAFPTDTKIRVSLTWLKYSTLSGTHSSATPTLGTLADLDLRVYDKNGNLVKSAISSQNNTEIVEFTPNTALNPYRIEVEQYSNSDRTVYYAVSWY